MAFAHSSMVSVAGHEIKNHASDVRNHPQGYLLCVILCLRSPVFFSIYNITRAQRENSKEKINNVKNKPSLRPAKTTEAREGGGVHFLFYFWSSWMLYNLVKLGPANWLSCFVKLCIWAVRIIESRRLGSGGSLKRVLTSSSGKGS